VKEPLAVRGTVIPASELSWRFSRSSGPGGQSVNTADSRVELSFDVAGSPTLPEPLRQRAVERLGDRLVDGVLTIAASETRSQLQNRRLAVQRLQTMLETATAPPARVRRPSRPTRGAVERRLDAKRRRSKLKQQRRGVAD
jgi:ribosome-associated protein